MGVASVLDTGGMKWRKKAMESRSESDSFDIIDLNSIFGVCTQYCGRAVITSILRSLLL